MLNIIKEKYGSQMTKDVVWTFIIQMIIMLCSFIITKLLSNRLSMDDFGQYNLIKRSTQVLSFMMLAGVGITLPRYIPLYQKGIPRKSIYPLMKASLIFILCVSLLVCLFCGVFHGELQQLMIGDSDNNLLYTIILAYAFLLALSQFTYAYYRGISNFKWYNGAQLGLQLAIIMPLILLPILTIKHVFASWLVITGAFVAFYWGRELWSKNWANGLKLHKKQDSSLLDELKIIIRYSSGRLLADFFLFSLSAFPLIYISHRQGFQATAHFSVGMTFVAMVTTLFSFMGIILLPFVSQCIARNEIKKACSFINQLLVLYITASFLLSIPFFLFTDFMTSLFFSEEYLVTKDLSRILLLSILPQALYHLYRNPIDAISIIPYNTIILCICLTVMVFTFSYSQSVTHLAWAYLIVSSLQGGLSWLTWTILKHKGS
jgi:O-antigen/teichoic acid export membrane protein